MVSALAVGRAADALRLPAEGRWSIATGWADGWAANWHHVDADHREVVGDWIVFTGGLRLPEGTWKLRDAERRRDDGLHEIRRRWEWTGPAALDRVTLSVRWQSTLAGPRPFLPGISYYDNPAGHSNDAERVPVSTTSVLPG